MLFATNPDDLRRRRFLVLAGAGALLVIAFLSYAVLIHRSDPSSARSIAPEQAAGSAAPGETPPLVDELTALRPSGDPDAFARQVTGALFEWDTATLISRADHVEQLVAVADPTGEATPGLVSDLDNYLPTPDAWTELAKYETRQWIAIDSVTTPSQWTEAEAQAGDQLLPGTTGLTIRGTRHRTGVWDGVPVASEHDVAFTVFIVCGPSYPECHLLRLSMLDKPLD